MQQLTQKLTALLELANNYPSPHNGQPIQVKAFSSDIFELYFVTDRGLKATPMSHLFSFVTVGVFMRHLERCAEALGHKINSMIELPEQTAMGGKGKLKCGTFWVEYDVAPPNEALQTAIQSRQTSRKQFTGGLDSETISRITTLAGHYNMQLKLADAEQAQQAIWLNQRAVFDDMFDPAVRTELNHWLRYSKAEKHRKQDGLSYDCMEMSGRALHFAVKHYKLLHWPIIAPTLKKYFLRTMRDTSTVASLQAAFTTEAEAYMIGRYVIDMWLDLTVHNYYLHPFGTIVSNPQAHQDFVKLMNITDESVEKAQVVFIFRAGTSPKPIESERLPLEKQLYDRGRNAGK